MRGSRQRITIGRGSGAEGGSDWEFIMASKEGFQWVVSGGGGRTSRQGAGRRGQRRGSDGDLGGCRGNKGGNGGGGEQQ